MWRDVAGACPIIPITNGVHLRTWQDPRISEALGSATGLRATHQTLKREMLAAIGQRTGTRLDPDVLTVGFARRAAGYKRSDLVFGDPARIEALLSGRRLQLVFAGKAHPDDAQGRRIVANLVAMARQYPGSVVFVPDYDMGIARLLTRGADVWLNNPIRPLEACGTSGMKAALNGVPNLSVLDGWWPEACRHGVNGWAIACGTSGMKAALNGVPNLSVLDGWWPEACRHGVNGWAIGDGTSGAPDQDERDRAALYATLENEVLPAYADAGRWVDMMRASIVTAERGFTSDRMVRDYFARLYGQE
ncbi:MAG: alpha-glucan family phosphorylase [Deltaproteobacteria bacterium]|nr:MAG: alpha-glucan family phosphorylase [Deltaproteobacteria bacterium]